MITLHYNKIRLFALCLMVIPAFIFLFGWLKLYIAIPAAALLGFAFFTSLKSEDKELKISVFSLVAIGVVIALWLYLSGVGMFFVQKLDHLHRNAMLRDLINYQWPVRYNDSQDSAFVYYFGHMLFPSLIGKIVKAIAGFEASWIAARVTIFLYSLVFLYTTILLVLFKLNKNSRFVIPVVLGVFIMFSGMDYIGQFFTFKSDVHIEYWPWFFQYISMSTQLCWVFNQAIPAWLATALVINEKDERSYALIGLSLIASSPLSLVGLAFYMLIKAIVHVASSKGQEVVATIRGILSPANVISAFVLVPIFLLFYKLNTATSESPLRFVDITEKLSQDSNYLFYYELFVLLEFLIYALLIIRRKNLMELALVIVSLLIIPFIEIGYNFDFCMRASIPFLFILMVYVMDFLTDKNAFKSNLSQKVRLIMLIAVLLIGSITPIIEYRTSFRYLHRYGPEFITHYDVYESIDDLPLDDVGRVVYVCTNSSDTIFFKYLAR